MTSQVLIRTIIEVQHQPGDERILSLVAAVSSIYPGAAAGTASAMPPISQGAVRTTAPAAPTLVPAKVAAAHVRSRARPAGHVHHQTVRRYIRDCELLAVNAPEGQLVPLGQLDASGFPPAPLRETLKSLRPDVRSAPTTVEWFMWEELGAEGETPIQLLHRGGAHDVMLVRRAAAQKWPAARSTQP